MRIPYLGKIRFHWCDRCHVPLIRKNCGLCGKLGRKVQLTPPGDIRPAFEGDLVRIGAALENHFGRDAAMKFQKLIKNQIIFLNKIPYIDRMDEIVIKGHIAALFRFNVVRGAFEFLPKLWLAREIWSPNTFRTVEVDVGAREFIKRGASVLSPGVSSADQRIQVDDPVIVTCENAVIAVGLAKMYGSEMGPGHRGVAVKTKYRKLEVDTPVKSSRVNWQKIIKANMSSIESLEEEAIGFIESTAKQHEYQVVAYSGGKDSLATLNLVSQSEVPYEIVFADTNLEYPETIENIKLVGIYYNKDVLGHENVSWDFWERFQKEPPTRNSRWCCKSAKLSPINRILEERFPKAREVLAYIGRRRYESLGRSRETRISKNPWIPQQVSAAPISNWTALEVYLYIQKHNLVSLLNPLYQEGFIRIGCWVCPASSLSDFKIMEEIHPELLSKLQAKLEMKRKENGLPDQYLSWGLWRWKYLPPKMVNLLKSKDIKYFSSSISSSNNGELKFRITKAPSPCVRGGYSALLSANQMLNLSRLERLLPIQGITQYNEELDILQVNMKRGHADIFRDGSIIIKDWYKEVLLTKRIISLIRTVYRSFHCDGCGVCIYQCSEKALVVESSMVKVDPGKCIHCLVCNNFCPLLRYRSDASFLE
ncbi:MAG: phosphoadenosine phosphosulfate reductase family protein [Candidatus Heimdallarchaeota archaeon]